MAPPFVSAVEKRVLEALVRGDPVGMYSSRIAEEVGRPRSGISQVLKRLRLKQFVSCVEIDEDLRLRLFHITSKGREALDVVRQVRERERQWT